MLGDHAVGGQRQLDHLLDLPRRHGGTNLCLARLDSSCRRIVDWTRGSGRLLPTPRNHFGYSPSGASRIEIIVAQTVEHSATDGKVVGSSPTDDATMIRFKEHYTTVVREERALSNDNVSSYERPKISGVTLHISLKPFRFNARLLAPRARIQEFAFGSRPTVSFSSLSEPELGVRQGAIVGMRSSKFNTSFLYDFRDRTLWNMAGLPPFMFSGWKFRLDMANTVAIRTPIPIYEYYARTRKDPGFKGRNRAQREWTLHLTNTRSSENNLFFVHGMGLPFVEVETNKTDRYFRSKTVRKYRKKVRKKHMKKKRTQGRGEL